MKRKKLSELTERKTLKEFCNMVDTCICHNSYAYFDLLGLYYRFEFINGVSLIIESHGHAIYHNSSPLSKKDAYVIAYGYYKSSYDSMTIWV